MARIVLFSLLALLMALFAFGSARANQWEITVPAVLLMVWLGDLARNSLRNVRKQEKN